MSNTLRDLLLGTILLALTCTASCTSDKKERKEEKKKQAESQAETSTPETAKAPTSCDPDLWKRVYNPSRLQVVADCKEATGTISELDQNPDGDTHMLLKLDAGQDDLLNKKNDKKKEGDLVVEVVCASPVSDKKVGETCSGYVNPVTIPKVGDHVRVTGSYVIDSHNGWAEIHPAS